MENKLKRRQAAYKRGQKGELLAFVYYSLRGYRLLAWRLKGTRHGVAGEVDLLFYRWGTVLAVEVKTRQQRLDDLPVDSPVSLSQQQRIRARVQQYLAKRPRLKHDTICCDVFWVGRWGRYQRIQNAF